MLACVGLELERVGLAPGSRPHRRSVQAAQDPFRAGVFSQLGIPGIPGQLREGHRREAVGQWSAGWAHAGFRGPDVSIPSQDIFSDVTLVA